MGWFFGCKLHRPIKPRANHGPQDPCSTGQDGRRQGIHCQVPHEHCLWQQVLHLLTTFLRVWTTRMGDPWFPKAVPGFQTKDLQSSILSLGHAVSTELCSFHTAWQAAWQVPLAAEGAKVHGMTLQRRHPSADGLSAVMSHQQPSSFRWPLQRWSRSISLTEPAKLLDLWGPTGHR